MKHGFNLAIGFSVAVLAVSAYAGSDQIETAEFIGWMKSLVIGAAFGGTCGLLAYSVPGAIFFSISMSLIMSKVSTINFDSGMIFGLMMIAFLRWLILPLLARRDLFPATKDITFISEVPILFLFGLILILTTELARMVA